MIDPTGNLHRKSGLNVLICGGAGYIGSHMCKLLARHGHRPVTFDNLSTGHEWAVKWGPFVRGDLLAPDDLAQAFRDHPIDAVMHFAALSIVSDSMREPARYFSNNVTGTQNLLNAMRAAGVDKLVFSSTAAVYGNPDYTPIDEAHPTRPINVYGWSKLIAERVIEEYCRAYCMRAVALRYFNAAGADSEGEIGEVHEPETHLIPSVLRAVLGLRSEPIQIFGEDYQTPDGTCVRDYVYIEDLCLAHLRALEFLDCNNDFKSFNIGGGIGISVKQVVQTCGDLTDSKIETLRAPRRTGDPMVLVADCTSAATDLKWKTTQTFVRCAQTALAWEEKTLFLRKSTTPL